jgi:hypothetical protein
MFAIASVTFAYTSCTDYSEDIENTNNRVSTLEGSVASLQSQVTTLQSTVSSLQTALTTAQNNITSLQNTLSALETKHDKDIADLETAYKAADDALKKSLEGQISALQTKHNQDVAAINQQITALQNLTTTLGNRIQTLEAFKATAEALLPTLATKTQVAELEKKVDDFIAKVEAILPTLATKQELLDAKAWVNENFVTNDKLSETMAWVEATFATKEALGEALKAIGALDGRLTIVETNLGKLLDETVPDIYTKIEAAHSAARAAQEDATKALGDIDALRKALGVYAEKGKLEETIAELVKTDSTLNVQILKLIEQDEKFKVDIQNLQNKDAYFDRVVDTLKAQDKIFDAAIIALQEKDKALDKVDAKHDSLITRLDEIKLNIADFQTYFDNALTEAVKDNGIVGKVINEKVTAAKNELTQKINDLDAKLMGEIAKINGIFPERLTSIVFVPQYYVGGIDAILFETLAYNGLDANENAVAAESQHGYVSEYKFNVSAETTAKYRFSPKTVGLDCADFDFVGNVAETRVVAPEAPIQIVGAPKYDAETGEVVFTVEKKENVKFQEGDNVDIVALKATLKKGLTDAEKVAEEKPVVFSEYERVDEDIIYAKDLAISDSIALVTGSKKYPDVAYKAWKDKKIHEFTKTFDDAVADSVVYEMAYDKDFDLGKLVATCISKENKHSQLDLAKFGLYYKYSVATSKYEIKTAQTTTNQQTNIKCVDPVKGIYRTTGTYADGTETEFNKESIGRTPIVKIELMHGDQVVTRAFVKLKIVVVHEPNILVVNDAVNYVYGSDGCGKEHKLVIDVERMRAQVYRVLNISHEEFWNTYKVESSVVTKNGKACNVTAPVVIDGTTSAGVATKEIVWIFKDDEVGVIGTTGTKLLATLKLVNKLANSSTYSEYVTFTFEFNYTLPDYKAYVDVVPKDIFWKDGILQANVNRPETTTDVAANCWFNTRIAKQPWDKFDIDLKGKLCIAKAEFVIVNVFENGTKKAYSNTTGGVYLTTYNGERSIALDKNNKDVKVALNSEKGLQAEVAYVATLQSGDKVTLYSFMVNFIRPLTLNMPEGLSVIDAKTGGDVIDFDFAGLLVDWRGELVLPPTWSFVERTNEWFFWKKVCSPADHALVVPEYQRVKTPASWKIDFEDVTIPIQKNETYTLYTYTHTYRYCEAMEKWFLEIEGANTNTRINTYWENADGEKVYNEPWFGRWTRHNRPTGPFVDGTVTGTGRSAEEAEQNALAAVDEIGAYFRNGYDADGCIYPANDPGELTTKEISGTTTTSVTFKNMVKATYTPEVYETVEARIIYSECSPMPTNIPFEQLNEGDRVGCWQWTKASYTWNQPVWEAGQYWSFYGPIGAKVDLDLDKVTTDLADKKLPAGASLVQTGNTLKYENVLSPIQYPYHIFIPATVTYGWGTLNSTMTILVKPVATIGGGE